MIFSDFVVDKTYLSLRSRDFGQVRTCRCYPSHAFGAGPFNRIRSVEFLAKFLDGAELLNKLGEQRREYLDKRERLFEVWKNARMKEGLAYQERVKTLKIIIPESLKEIFNKVNAVAAQK